MDSEESEELMSKEIHGSCMCGEVHFTVKDEFSMFYFCHCQQCQKLTGSAHASNVFTSPDNISWDKGEESIQHYEHPSRSFSNNFCRHCGSALPFVTKSGKYLIVPAGSLDKAPAIKPQANIFHSERASWHEDGLKAMSYEGFEE